MQGLTFLELENLFLALSDKTRLRLLALMANGEVSVGYLADRLGESQPKISRHLAYLRNTGIVSARRDGKWIYYNIQLLADTTAQRVLNVTINSILGREPERARAELTLKADEFRKEEDIYAETYEGEYQPNEIEIYLL